MTIAVALLSIATAFSLPRFHRLANHVQPADVAAPTALRRNAAPGAAPQVSASSAKVPSASVKTKIIDLLHGYPDPTVSGNVLMNWSGFAANAEPKFHVLAKADAPSGGKCAEASGPPQSAKTAPPGTILDTTGC